MRASCFIYASMMYIMYTLHTCLFPVYTSAGSFAGFSTSLIPKASGIVLMHRDTVEGTKVEYKDDDMLETYHTIVFPFSGRSFAVEQGESDVLVIAEENTGLVSRAIESNFLDHIIRPSPHSVSYVEYLDGDKLRKVMFWLEYNKEKNTSYFSLSVFDEERDKYGTTEAASLSPDHCYNATHAVVMKVVDEDSLIIPVICSDTLHIINFDAKIPPFSADGSLNLKAESNPIKLSETLTNVVGVARSTTENTLYIAMSNGIDICRIVRQKNIDNGRNTEFAGSLELVFDCKEGPSTFEIRGLAVHQDYLYVSTYTPGCLLEFCIGIHRLNIVDEQLPATKNQLESLVTRYTEELITPELFSPGYLHIKSLGEYGHHLFWLDMLDGKISRLVFKRSDVHKARLVTEKVIGRTTVGSFVLRPNAKATESPSLLLADYGLNKIWSHSLRYGVAWKDMTETPTLIANTASSPYGLTLDVKDGHLYWSEPLLSKIVQFDLNSGKLVQNFTFRFDTQEESYFNKIAFSPATKRIYAADSLPANCRIVSWSSSGGMPKLEWQETDETKFVPGDIVADPVLDVLYVSDKHWPRIYSVHLNIDVHQSAIKDSVVVISENPGIVPSTTTTTRPGTTQPKGTKPVDRTEGYMTEVEGKAKGSTKSAGSLRALKDKDANAQEKSNKPRKTKATVAIFYEAKEMTEHTHIQSLWINEENLHWIETSPSTKKANNIVSTIYYTPLLRSRTPFATKQVGLARRFSSSETRSYIGAAQFYQVHEGYQPRNIWEALSYVAVALASFGILVAVCGCLCRPYGRTATQEEKQALRRPSVIQEEYTVIGGRGGEEEGKVSEGL